MYSNEIDKLIKLKKYVLSVSEYLKICQTSPQISYVKFEPDKEEYDINIWTNDNYYWKVKVYK